MAIIFKTELSVTKGLMESGSYCSRFASRVGCNYTSALLVMLGRGQATFPLIMVIDRHRLQKRTIDMTQEIVE